MFALGCGAGGGDRYKETQGNLREMEMLYILIVHSCMAVYNCSRSLNCTLKMSVNVHKLYSNKADF